MKTRPKKENDKLSFLKRKVSLTPIVIDTNGKNIVDNPIQDYADFDRQVDTTTHSPSVIESQTLEFEIPLPYSALQRYMSRQNSTGQGSQSLWVHGIINKHTSEIIIISPGRLSDNLTSWDQ